MNDLNAQLIDYIDKNLSAEQHKAIERSIAESPAVRAEYEELKALLGLMDSEQECLPSAHLQNRFDLLIEQESKKLEDQENGIKTIRFSPRSLLKYAAVGLVLLVSGYFVGQNIRSKSNPNTLAQVGQFTESQMIAMLDEPSTSQRIKAVNIGYNMENADDKIIEALIETMHKDESSNVRLAAAHALERFSSHEKVVDALIYSLETPNDPMVTIAVINILANIKEKKALEPLEKIATGDSHLNFVKDEAEVGIFKLNTI